MKVYLAGPFFNNEEIIYIEKLEKILREREYEVFSPREHTIPNGKDMPNERWGYEVFKMDVEAITECDVVLAVYHGMYSDTGTAWEIGYAYANNVPIVLLCTDKETEQSLMVVNAGRVLTDIDEIKTYDFEELPETKNIISTQK